MVTITGAFPEEMTVLIDSGDTSHIADIKS